MLAVMARREISVRYKQTALGITWTVLQPIVSTAIFSVIFGILARFPSGEIPYPVFVFSGLLIWQYFSRSLSDGCGSIVAYGGMLSKIYFPRILLPLIGPIANAVDLFISLTVLITIMLALGLTPSWALIFIPIVVLLAGAFAYAIALILAPLNALYRDIGIVVPYALQMLLFMTPILFPSEIVPERFRILLDFHPIATLVSLMRHLVVGAPAPSLLAITFLLGVLAVLLVLGVRTLTSLEATLVDRI